MDPTPGQNSATHSRYLLGSPWLERVALTAASIGFYLLYIPVSRYSVSLEPRPVALAIDRQIPLMDGWMYVYAAVFISGFLPALVVASPRLFRRMVAAYLLVQVVAFGFFVIWPVHMDLRPAQVVITDFPSWGLRLAYHLDPVGACFPSIHVTLASLSALCCVKVDRLVGGLAQVGAVVIALSTLFVKQHFVADVLLGFALAYGAWALLVERFPLHDVLPSQRHLPRWIPALLIVPYLGVVGVLYVLYLADWTPWVS